MTKARNIPVKYGVGKPPREDKNRRRQNGPRSKKVNKYCIMTMPIDIVIVDEYEIDEITRLEYAEEKYWGEF